MVRQQTGWPQQLMPVTAAPKQVETIHTLQQSNQYTMDDGVRLIIMINTHSHVATR